MRSGGGIVVARARGGEDRSLGGLGGGHSDCALRSEQRGAFRTDNLVGAHLGHHLDPTWKTG